jgi:hypothetical protein
MGLPGEMHAFTCMLVPVPMTVASIEQPAHWQQVDHFIGVQQALYVLSAGVPQLLILLTAIRRLVCRLRNISEWLA